MYAKDLSEPKNEFLIKKRENHGAKHFNDSKIIIECSNMMFMKILLITTQTEKEVLIVFNDMVAYIMCNEKF